MTNLEKYNSVFVSIFNVDADQLNDDFARGSVKAWDSMCHLTLVTEIEDSFEIMLDTDDILAFNSYPNGKKILAQQGIEMD